MISPKLVEQLISGMPSAPSVVVAKASEDPVLQKLLAPLREHKQRGAELFKARDVAGADGGWWAGGFRSRRVRAARTLACEVEADACTAAAAEALEVDFDGSTPDSTGNVEFGTASK